MVFLTQGCSGGAGRESSIATYGRHAKHQPVPYGTYHVGCTPHAAIRQVWLAALAAMLGAALDEQRYEIADRALVELRTGFVDGTHHLAGLRMRERFGQALDDLVDRPVLLG